MTTMGSIPWIVIWLKPYMTISSIVSNGRKMSVTDISFSDGSWDFVANPPTPTTERREILLVLLILRILEILSVTDRSTPSAKGIMIFLILWVHWVHLVLWVRGVSSVVTRPIPIIWRIV